MDELQERNEKLIDMKHSEFNPRVKAREIAPPKGVDEPVDDCFEKPASRPPKRQGQGGSLPPPTTLALEYPPVEPEASFEDDEASCTYSDTPNPLCRLCSASRLLRSQLCPQRQRAQDDDEFEFPDDEDDEYEPTPDKRKRNSNRQRAGVRLDTSVVLDAPPITITPKKPITRGRAKATVTVIDNQQQRADCTVDKVDSSGTVPADLDTLAAKCAFTCHDGTSLTLRGKKKLRPVNAMMDKENSSNTVQ